MNNSYAIIVLCILLLYLQYLKSSLKKAKLEVEQLTFEFDKEKLTLKIVEKAVPGWIIEPLVDPCTVSHI